MVRNSYFYENTIGAKLILLGDFDLDVARDSKHQSVLEDISKKYNLKIINVLT